MNETVMAGFVGSPKLVPESSTFPKDENQKL